MGLLAVGSRPASGAGADFWEPICHAGLPHPVAGEGVGRVCSCLNLTYCALLTPHWSPDPLLMSMESGPLSEWRLRRGGWEAE